MYRSSPVEWQNPSGSSKETAANKSATSAKSPKKDIRKPKGKKDE